MLKETDSPPSLVTIEVGVIIIRASPVSSLSLSLTVNLNSPVNLLKAGSVLIAGHKVTT